MIQYLSTDLSHICTLSIYPRCGGDSMLRPQHFSQNTQKNRAVSQTYNFGIRAVPQRLCTLNLTFFRSLSCENREYLFCICSVYLSSIYVPPAHISQWFLLFFRFFFSFRCYLFIFFQVLHIFKKTEPYFEVFFIIVVPRRRLRAYCKRVTAEADGLNLWESQVSVSYICFITH